MGKSVGRGRRRSSYRSGQVQKQAAQVNFTDSRIMACPALSCRTQSELDGDASAGCGRVLTEAEAAAAAVLR
jgi:hypothetical protein